MNTKTNNISNGWRLYPLKEFYSVVGNLSLPREFLTKKEQNYGYIHYGDIHTQMLPEIINSDTPISYLLNTKKISNIENYFLQQGDIIVVDASEDYDGVAKAIEINSIKNKKIVAGLHTIALRPLNKNSIVSKFGPYLFKHPVVIKRLRAISQGTKVFSINFPLIEKVKFFLPPMEEQRRIVEVLECWDKGIELVKKLIEQKELQKKGLLQNLVYNQPTCKNFYLGNLFSLGRGRVISKEEIQHNKGTYPVYSSQTSDNGILGYINSFDFEGEYLTWTTDGANAGKVFYRRGQFNCTNVCGTAKPHNSNLVNLYYVMSYLNKVTKRYVSYVGNPKLMNGVFSKIAIPLPEKTTQDWAATVLETADKEIDLLKQKLAKLEAQKKGLMQVLLTGKIRLK